MDSSFEIDPIVIKYIREEPLSAEETTLLRQWVAGGDGREDLLQRVKNDLAWVQNNLGRMQASGTDPIWKRVEAKLREEGHWSGGVAGDAAGGSGGGGAVVSIAGSGAGGGKTGKARVVRSVIRLRPLLIAAGFTIVIAGAAWWLRSGHRLSGDSASSQTVLTADIQPGGNKAILTLADGSKINLDSSANGVLAAQGNMKVSKVSDGKLAYNKSSDDQPADKAMPMVFNSLSTPRAGQFTLTLPDGTQVWLNNASTIRYPIAFTGADRTVELTGEAYFEVSKDAAHPFRVLVHRNDASGAAGAPPEGGAIEVLGTSFNVMAYTDEPEEQTTLVDGSVRFTRGGSSVQLKPEEQSVLDAKGALTVIPHVNVGEVTAWKNGYFHFDHASFESTMRQLARWYDVDVHYEGTVARREFMGKIQRSLPLSAVLKGLENDQVHFKLEGRDLTVMP